MAVKEIFSGTKKKSNLQPRNSLSESDLTTAGRNLISGFPPGTTVDELWLYRKRRPSANLCPKDNLTLRSGSFKSLKTEYKRRFKNFYEFGPNGELIFRQEEVSPVRAFKPDDSLKLEGSLEHNPEYYETFIQYNSTTERPRRNIRPITDSFQLIDFSEMNQNGSREVNEKLSTENRSNYIQYSGIQRPEIIKRATNLKLEGELFTTTEQAEKFVQLLLSNRPELIRKSTNLKMEGELDTKTENREKFIPFDYQNRPPLCKKFTNLHLEGDLNVSTENREKFTPYPIQQRPPLTKKSTNLHIEGELDLQPEYRREYIEYKVERPKPALPIDNLGTDGFYHVDNESHVTKPFEQQMHPQIPFLRGSEHYDSSKVPARRREPIHRTEGQIETITENSTQYIGRTVCKPEKSKVSDNLHLEGKIDLNPEYRNAYIDFNKDAKIEARSRRMQQTANLKTEGKMEIAPEYSSSYVDFPRERPTVKRPECHLSSEGEVTHMTEQNEKFQAFINAPRTKSVTREPELKPEGRFECQPEYRKAYINYLTRERVERKPRPLDNSSEQPKRAIEVEPVIKTTFPKESPIKSTPKVQENLQQATVSQQIRVKTGTKSSKNLQQIETELFGPKLTIPTPSKVPSRSSTPVSMKRKSKSLPRRRNLSPNNNNSTTTDSDAGTTPRKFNNPILVENLAVGGRPQLPPSISNVTTRNKWMRSSSVESSSAFVVLDKEINNNAIKSGKNGFLLPPRNDRHY